MCDQLDNAREETAHLNRQPFHESTIIGILHQSNTSTSREVAQLGEVHAEKKACRERIVILEKELEDQSAIIASDKGQLEKLIKEHEELKTSECVAQNQLQETRHSLAELSTKLKLREEELEDSEKRIIDLVQRR